MNVRIITTTNATTEVNSSKTSLEKFSNVIKIVRFCSSRVGLDVLDEHFKPNLLTYFVLLAIFLFYLFSYLTITKFFHEDWIIILDVLTTAGGCTQGFVKFITGWFYSKQFYQLYQDLNGIYLKYQPKGEKYERVLCNFGDKMKKVLVIVGVIYFVTIFLTAIIPVVILLYNGKQYLILLVHVPGLDVSTHFGYYLTSVFHFICVCIAAFGLYAGDTFVLMFLTHSLLFHEIFALKVEDLNNMIEEEVSEDSKIFETLSDMLQWHQFYLRFNDTCNDLLYWLISTQIFSSALSITITIVIIMIRDWPGAYAYLIMSITALYVYCILGTRIEICNDQFRAEIYNINWYTLSVSQQKIVRVMLMRSQTPNIINVAGVLPLTVNTALRITKTIYSIFMMMLRLVD